MRKWRPQNLSGFRKANSSVTKQDLNKGFWTPNSTTPVKGKREPRKVLSDRPGDQRTSGAAATWGSGSLRKPAGVLSSPLGVSFCVHNS